MNGYGIGYFVTEACFHGSETSSGFRYAEFVAICWNNRFIQSYGSIFFSINDLPSRVSPGNITRLFCRRLLYLQRNRINEYQVIFQRDMSAICDAWAKRWGMWFNPSKCSIVMTDDPIHRSQSLFSKSYDLSGVTLEEVEHAC